VNGLRALDHRIHGLVLWNDDIPVIEAQDEPSEKDQATSRNEGTLAGIR
jgi:hypothetical protein